MMFKYWLFIACFMFSAVSLAQNESVKLFPENAPGEREKLFEKQVDGGVVGGRPVILLTEYRQRTYPPIDTADDTSCRPDFCLLVYPAYLSDENFGVKPEIKVTQDTPPTMIIQTQDDKNHINSSLFYYYVLKEAGVTAEMHLYSKGGHGYGLRNTGAVVNEWTQRAEDWLREMEFVK